MEDQLNQIAAVDLSGCATIGAMAEREAWDPDRYAITLAENCRESGMSLDTQRERLACLAQVGAGLDGDSASAGELARHFAVLDALFQRFARASVEAMGTGRPGSSETAERYLKASITAQRAALACLSALHAIRDKNRSPTTPAAVPTLAAK